jgi:hypothetical protein
MTLQTLCLATSLFPIGDKNDGNKNSKETRTNKKILRALRLDNIFGKTSNFEEDAQLNLQDDHESLIAYAWIEHKNALLDAERTKAEALMTQRKQRFI